MLRKELAVLGEMVNKKYIIAVAINRGTGDRPHIQIFKRSMTYKESDTKRPFMRFIARRTIKT